MKTAEKVKSIVGAPAGISETDVKVFNDNVVQAENYGTTLQVTTDDEYKAALEEGKFIKLSLDAVTARKEEMTRPLNDSLKSIREFFKPFETRGETALSIIKSKMLKYAQDKQRKADADKQKLAERVERGTMKPETAVRKMNEIKAPEKTVATDTASSTVVSRKAYRVVDKTKIPLEFMEPNMVAIKTQFKAGIPVPGVEEYLEQDMRLS